MIICQVFFREEYKSFWIIHKVYKKGIIDFVINYKFEILLGFFCRNDDHFVIWKVDNSSSSSSSKKPISFEINNVIEANGWYHFVFVSFWCLNDHTKNKKSCFELDFFFFIWTTIYNPDDVSHILFRYLR